MFGFTKEEERLFFSLSTPKKIQDYLESISINFEEHGDTCMSPRRVIREKRAHCIEGALFAATALRYHGHRPLVVDMVSAYEDFDHVITVFRLHNSWGAITKTNHAVLRYREPVYKTIRELIMSYFHEYFLDNGKKTLRSFSQPIDLSRFDKKNWMTDEKNVWYIPRYLNTVPHSDILNNRQLHGLRKADPIEIKAGKLTDQKRKTRH